MYIQTNECPRCAMVSAEDTQFAAEMHRYGLPQRRFHCPAGHSFYQGVPEGAAQEAAPPRLPHQSRLREKICQECHEPYMASPNQKFCSDECLDISDARRYKARNLARASTTPPEAIRKLRELPSVWKRGGWRPFGFKELPRD